MAFIAALSVFPLLAGAAGDQQPDTSREPAPAVRGQFIVKLKPSGEGVEALDRLNKRSRVVQVRQLHRARNGRSTVQARDDERERIRRIKARFARRTGRAAAHAAPPDLTDVYLFESEEADVEALARLYREDPHVEYAHPNYLVHPHFEPNDPYYASSGSWQQAERDLWNLQKISAASAWDVTQGEGEVVAVVDTGVDYTHPDIAANIWANPGEIPANGVDDDSNGYVDDVRGWDFSRCAYFDMFYCSAAKPQDNDPMDLFGHGTHVAGTIAAVGDNGLGVIGVAPRARIMPLQAFNESGGASSADLAEAVVYAAENGASVINNSWGCGGRCLSNPVIEEAVRHAHALGAVVVFSAGNSADDAVYYSPQNLNDPKPIVVAASTPDDQPAYFSNSGFLVDVTAPGGGHAVPPPDTEPARNILSLKSTTTFPLMDWLGQLIVGESYLRQAGTSMSAPLVSGVAALLLAAHPELTNEDVRQILRVSADDVGSAGHDTASGAGRLHAARALATTAPGVQIGLTSPRSGVAISRSQGTVELIGTAAGQQFASYRLSYGAGFAPAAWTDLGAAQPAPVAGGTLGTWTISGLAEGWYLLQLAVTADDGRVFRDYVPVVIERPMILRASAVPTSQQPVAVSGSRVVWTDYRNGAGNGDIYLYDLGTGVERQITTSTAPQQNPSISGDLIVWEDQRNGINNHDIYLYDLATGTERPVTTHPARQLNPAIDGTRVVWSDNRGGGLDIIVLDLTTGTELQLTNGGYGVFPAISGTRVVWQSMGVPSTIWLHDLATHQTQVIGAGTAHQQYPDIEGDLVVWTDESGNGDNIRLYNIATRDYREVTTGTPLRNKPAVSGTRVVWEDYRNGNWDIYTYNVATGLEEAVTHDLGGQVEPEISGQWIVWTDTRRGGKDVYAAGLGEPTLDPLPSKAIGAGKMLIMPVRARDLNREVLTISAPALPPGGSLLPKGDVTMDGALSGSDVTKINACAAGTPPACNFVQVALGDVAGPGGLVEDGKLTAIDAQTVQSMLAVPQHPEADPALLDLVNTSLLVWPTTAAQGDEDAYVARFRAADAAGAFDDASANLTVTPKGPNLLVNGGFELDRDGWSGWGTNKQVTTAQAYSGLASVGITLGGQARRIYQVRTGIIPGARYRLYASLKPVNLGATQAYVQVIWRKAGGSAIRTDTFGHVSGNSNWVRQASAVLTAPPETAKVEVGLQGDHGSNGSLYFDSVRLEHVP